MKIMCVLGTRPEAIKMAPIILELRQPSHNVQSVVCVTAQHREMLDQVLDLFQITPDYDLNLMKIGQTPTQVAARTLTQLEPLFQRERPDWVLVQGDTTTTMAAALGAFYEKIRVGHVEAGLRTHDKWQPFPEEINRCLVGITADMHFAPTPQARMNLLREGISEENIIVTGNPVIDALYHFAALPPSPSSSFLWQRISPQARWVVLVTAHRRENFGKPLERICGALRDLVTYYGDQLQVVYPVHKNPNVWEPVHRMLADLAQVLLISPVDYLTQVHLMKRAHLILTDSGGIQEEGAGLGKPVLILREKTERPEAILAGAAKLVGTNRENIVDCVKHLIDDEKAYHEMANAVNPFGDGQASKRIVGCLLNEPRLPLYGADVTTVKSMAPN